MRTIAARRMRRGQLSGATVRHPWPLSNGSRAPKYFAPSRVPGGFLICVSRAPQIMRRKEATMGVKMDVVQHSETEDFLTMIRALGYYETDFSLRVMLWPFTSKPALSASDLI